MYETLTLIAVFVFLYSISSGGLERTLFSGAVVFAAFGVMFGPLGLDFLSLNIEKEGLRTLAELTLALVLFIDAANANLDASFKGQPVICKYTSAKTAFAVPLLIFASAILLLPNFCCLSKQVCRYESDFTPLAVFTCV